MTEDDRIVCGAVNCVWWDHISKAGSRRGMPCCPFCGAMLLEFFNEREWFEMVDKYNVKTDHDYKAFINWLRGKCFKKLDDAKTAWERSIRRDN